MAARGTPRRRTCATRDATWSSASARARPITSRRSRDGFKPVSAAEAAEAGDLINILLPDEVQGDIYTRDIKPHLRPGRPPALLARVQHPLRPGRSARGRRLRPGRPQGPGPPGAQRVRQGGRRPLPDRHDRKLLARRARRWHWPTPRGSAAPAAGVLQTTFAEETETDLFGEQVVLCGGVSALVKMAFETLIEAGYQPESAYFECLHELKLIVDLMYQGGLNYMRYSISNTAEYGDYTRGPRIVNEQTRAEMKKILAEIRSGQFAREWILENRANRPVFNATKRLEREHPVEQVGKRLRSLMPWIDAKTV